MNTRTLPAARGARHRKLRLGRGVGSGRGKTATRGQKGQNARTGSHKRPGFEGGRNPLIRRIPKRGFRRKARVYRVRPAILNVWDLNRCADGDRVAPEQFREMGLIRDGDLEVKLLGDGVLKKRLTVVVHRATESARAKVVQAGGTVELIDNAHAAA